MNSEQAQIYKSLPKGICRMCKCTARSPLSTWCDFCWKLEDTNRHRKYYENYRALGLTTKGKEFKESQKSFLRVVRTKPAGYCNFPKCEKDAYSPRAIFCKFHKEFVR